MCNFFVTQIMSHNCRCAIAIPDTNMNMKKSAFGVLSIVRSTYVCELVFKTLQFFIHSVASAEPIKD